MDPTTEKVNRLHEAANNGDIETLENLCQIINVNSKNSVNGWTALHWASKRNHIRVVELLLSQGADKTVCNSKDETPAQLTDNPDILQLLGVTPDDAQPQSKTNSELPITPNYLAHPPFPYVHLNKESPASIIKERQPTPDTNNMSLPAHELVLKARVANMEETDFIEVEMDKQKLTFAELVQLLCAELNVEPKLVHKVRKLPNTIVRKDKDVTRLKDFQEIELVLSNKLKSPLPKTYGNFNGIGSNIKQEQILY